MVKRDDVSAYMMSAPGGPTASGNWIAGCSAAVVASPGAANLSNGTYS